MRNIIFDFDSTIVKNESFNDVLKIALGDDKRKIKQIDEIVNKSMNGLITTKEAMDFRLQIATINKKQIQEVIEKTEIVDGMEELIKELIKDNNIYIVSGGFTEMIMPTANKLGINPEYVYANEFVYDNDIVVEVKKNLLLEPQGKVKTINNLLLEDKKIMVGDGWTDYETLLFSAVDEFIAFYGVIKREKVDAKANLKANDANELKEILNLL
ncbi:MAG: phosphoserine phosphatase [Rickettsiales bacterium]|nr:MAG: phosphoserine phosphatase [Rickettsiales bacterium]